jgi:hypothetical protein
MKNILENRDCYIGGSDLPKLMTEGNLYKFALEKLNPTFEGNEHTNYGHFMEPILREYINYTEDYDFKPSTVYKGIFRGNCDGVYGSMILEIKTFTSELDIKYYMPQIQAYLHLFNKKVSILLGYQKPHNFFTWGNIKDRQSYNLDFDESRAELFYIPADPEHWKKIQKKATKFWKAFNALKINPKITEEEFNTILYGKQLVSLVNNYQDFKHLEKEIIKQDVYKAKIGDLSINRTDFIDVTIDTERLSRELPHVFEEYKKINHSTKINITRRKSNVTN